MTDATPPAFTEADVRRYAQHIAGHPDAQIDPRHLTAARAVLDALARDGRLLPPPAERKPDDAMRWPAGRPGWLGQYQLWPCGRCTLQVAGVEKHECFEAVTIPGA